MQKCKYCGTAIKLIKIHNGHLRPVELEPVRIIAVQTHDIDAYQLYYSESGESLRGRIPKRGEENRTVEAYTPHKYNCINWKGALRRK